VSASLIISLQKILRLVLSLESPNQILIVLSNLT
jgi:hypothetical protein